MAYVEKVVKLAKKRRKKGKKGKHRTKIRQTWTEFRAGLTLVKKTTLISVIKILWPSASKAAKNKVCKLAANAIKHVGRKVKAKSKGKRKGKKKAWQIKGSAAAKRHMAKIRNKRR